MSTPADNGGIVHLLAPRPVRGGMAHYSNPVLPRHSHASAQQMNPMVFNTSRSGVMSVPAFAGRALWCAFCVLGLLFVACAVVVVGFCWMILGE